MSPLELPADFLGLAGVVLMLGMKHGFDPDHLAAIDGLACHNAPTRPRIARLSGVLFSLGHGTVVVAVALGVSLLAQAWQAPAWLEAVGAWVSITALTLIALVNLIAVARTPGDEVARLSGWRSGVFGRLLRAGDPLMVMGVGVLFALSFDTVSQAALFAMTAGQFGGWQPALLLALLFTGGMLLTDGINGWWIARLIHGSARAARVASRVFAISVSGVGLLTAALTLSTRLVPAMDRWANGRGLWLGAAVVALLLAGFFAGQWLARTRGGAAKSLGAA
jgi:high-affinity nickel-transport protein